MVRITPIILLAVMLSPALASSSPTSTPHRATLSPAARLALRLSQRGQGLLQPGRAVRTEATVASVALEFAAPPTSERLGELAEAGVEFYTRHGEILRIGALVPAKVPFELLEALEFAPDLVRVELRLSPPRPGLVENAPAMVEVPVTHRTLDTAGLGITGKGVTVGILDSWVDLFHPWFFRPDGGARAWLDVDGSGDFKPGVDGIDGDGDGEISETETLRLLKGSAYWNEGTGQQSGNAGPDYYPPLDWLYLDTNGNGKRDFGPTPGYKESTPAYGEPLFVADDVDGDGALGIGEKVVGLKTSKFAQILFVGSGNSFRRGDNLIEYPRLLNESSHATMTLGVLAGGAAPYQPYSGVAPDVDILLADTNQGGWGAYGEGGYGGSYLAASIALVDAGAQVLMHEYGWPLLEFGDGTSVLETGIDELAATAGVVSCTAAHNYAGYDMHAEATIPAAGTVTFPMAMNIYGDDYPTSGLYLTLRHRVPGTSLTLRMLGPGGIDVVVPEAEGELEGPGLYWWFSGIDVSSRNTAMVSLAVFPDGWNAPMPGPDWALEVTNGGEDDVVVDLFAADQTGYLYTANIQEYVTKAGTMAHPATADSAITAGAYRANVDSWYGQVEIGDLSFYSGRGPRIDGERGLDIVGPSDMLSSWYDPDFPAYPGLSYASGTSGSLPQVTGVVALLLQAEPDLLAAAVKERVLAGAIRDTFTGADENPTWGAGKLSAYRTLFGSEPPDNEAPLAIAHAPAQVRLQEPFVLDASDSTDDGGSENLEVRWDIGYNGSWDIPYRSELTLAVEALYEPGLFLALAQVRDAEGWTDRALVQIQVVDELYQPPVEPAPDLLGEPAFSDALNEADQGPESDLGGGAKATSDKGCTLGIEPPTGAMAPVLLLLALLALALAWRPGAKS